MKRGMNPGSLGGEMGFHGYCKAIALGGGLPAASAKLCLKLAGRNAGAMRADLNARTERGEFDAKRYALYSDALTDLADMFAKGIQTHKVDTSDKRDWAKLDDGRGTMRINHIEQPAIAEEM
jgi:hypothetical protein